MSLYQVQSKLTGKIYPFSIAGNEPTAEEEAIMTNYILQNERPSTEVDGDDEQSIFGQAIGRGFDLIQKNLGSAIEGFGKTTGIDAIKDYGTEVVEKNEKELAENSDKAKRLDDIKDVGSFFDWTASTLGEQLPNLGYTLSGAGAGAAIGSFVPIVGPLAGSIIGGIGANLPFFYGGNREAQKEEIAKGNRIEISEGAAFLASGFQAPLDFIADRLLVSGFTGKLFAGGGLFTKGVKASEVAGSAAKGIAAGTIIEVPTELGQQVIERYQAGKSLTSEEAIDEYKEVAAAAGLLGGAVRGTGQTIFGSKLPEKTNTKELQMAEDARVAQEKMKVQKAKSLEITEKIIQSPEQPTAEDINIKENKTQELLDASKETQTGYSPVALKDLDPKNAEKIRKDRINVKRDVSPTDTDADATIEEIQTILGKQVADTEKAKQKPNLLLNTIKFLDNNLINLDGAINANMERKRQNERAKKNSTNENDINKATEEIKKINAEIDTLTNTKAIQEQQYNEALETYKNSKVKKKLDLQYDKIKAKKASPEAEKVATQDTFEPTPEYFAKKDRVQESLQKELNNIGLKDVQVRVEPKDLDPNDPNRVVEGFFDVDSKSGQKFIALSMSLYDPSMSDADLLAKLRSVLHHEILHAVRDLQIITPKEYNSLVEAAKKRKYVLKEGNKTVIRDYSYVDRAIHMYRHNKDYSREDIHEEAVAEMFRDYADGKLVLVARPKNIFDKIIKAIKAIFSAHQENNFTRADQIFQNILSTDTEKNIKARQDTGSKPKESAFLIPGVEVRENPDDKSARDDFFEAMGEEGVLLEVPRIKTLLDRYTQNNNRSAIEFAVIDPDYEIYKNVLDANLERLYPDNKIPLRRMVNYAEVMNEGANPEYIADVFTPSDIVAAGNDGERELILNLNGDIRSFSMVPSTRKESAITIDSEANRLLTFIKDNPDGFTIDIDSLEFSAPQGGIAVAPVKAAEIVLDLKDLTIDKVYEFAETVTLMSKLGDVKMYAGGWKNVKTDKNPKGDNKFYLDATIVVDDLNDALYIGDAAQQEAVFNLATFEETRTEDAIKRLQETSSYDSNAHNERRRYVQQLTQKFKKARRRGEIESRVRDIKDTQKRTERRPSAEDQGLKITPTTDENGMVTLTHFSPIEGLEEIRPDQQGTNSNIRGQESLRRRYFSKDYPARNYYGLDVDQDYGYKKEYDVGDNAYEAKVPLENLYDMDTDEQKLKPVAIKQAEGDPDQSLYAATLLEKAIKEKGFIGYYANNASLGLVAAIFQPLSVKPAKRPKFSEIILPAGAKDIGRYLLPSERDFIFENNRFGKDRAETLFQLFTKNLPSAFEMANVAVAGIEKKGWYKRSAKGIVELFGVHDGRRFAALLAATSPQTPVDRNLSNALKVWIAWSNNGRPTDVQRIEEVSRIAIGNEFDLYRNNLLRSLSTPDGQEMSILLSGPKVNSFMMNLIGNVEEITNDTWMVNYAAVDIDPKLLKSQLKRDPTKAEIAKGTGRDAIGIISTKKPNYIALSAKTREAAEVATEITGEPWTPAEIQETVWSFAKALGDMLRSSPKSASELLVSGALTNQDIASVPDFATLMSDGIYRQILERGGYGERLRIIDSAETGRIDPRREGSVLRIENRKIDAKSFQEAILQAADRIETNISTERINRKFSAREMQPEYRLIKSPTGSNSYGVIPYGDRGLNVNVVFPEGRHLTSGQEKTFNENYGDGFMSFGLRHIQADRPGVETKIINHQKDLLKFTNYKRFEDALAEVIKVISDPRNLILRNNTAVGYKKNRDFDVTQDKKTGTLTFNFTESSKVNNRKSGERPAPFRLVLQLASRKKPDPRDRGLPPENSFENTDMPMGVPILFVKTMFNQNPRFSAIPVEEVVPEKAVELDKGIQDREQEIRYNNLAPILAKPLKIFFKSEKAEDVAENIVIRFQDALQPVGKMMDALRDKGFKVANAFDAYLKEKLFHGKVKDLTIKAYENLYTPMGELIKQINVDQSALDALEATKGTIAFRVYKDQYPDIRLALADLFLYARHAKERNKFVLDNKQRTLGSSMSDSEADTYLNWFNSLDQDQKNIFTRIAAQAREIAQDTTNKRIEAGLIPTDIQEVFKDFKNYVPLRGDTSLEDEIQADNSDTLVKRKAGTFFGGRGRPDPKIKGRVYKDAAYAEFIVPSLLSQNQKTIEDAQRNIVGRAMLDLFEGKEVSPTGEVTVSQDLKNNIAEFGEVMDEKTFNKLDNDTKALRIITVRRDGKNNFIYLNDAKIARAMKYHFSPDTMGSVVRFMSQVNRFLSNVNTSWNPSFVIPNFARDLETAGVNIQQYGEKGIGKEVAYTTLKALKGIRDNLRSGEKDSEWAKEYLLFREYGGQNATNQMGDLETQVRNIKEVLDGVGENARMGKLGLVKNAFISKGKSILSFLDDYNTAVENGVRVATFRALRNRGMTIERAAEAARDITVNFAKGGTDKAFMNAWFLFYNASLQGSMALFNAAVRSKRVRKFWGGLIVYGILQDQINALLSGDEDDNGILDYDQLSPYELEHNLILPVDWITGSGDKMLKIPLAYGLNMAVNTGRALSRAARGEYTVGEATNSITRTATEMINPLGGTESFLNFVAPTVADPFVSLYINKDYKGDPIVKESPIFASRPTPDAHSHWNTTGEIPKAIAKSLNDFLGGNEVRSGLIDMSPDTIQFWFDYITGGAGRFVLRTGETILFDVPEILAGDFEGKIMPRIPLVRKVIATPSEVADTGTYLENRKELFTIFAELDIARKAGDTERIKDVMEKYSDELRIYGRLKAIDNARNRLLRQIKKIERNPRLEDERKKQLIRNIRKKIQDFQKRGLILMRSAGLREAS